MMASARARLMTAVDLTLTVQGDDPDAPIVHEVQGPGVRMIYSRCGRTSASISR